jgi:Flp pilus assembly protein protease CpaA
MILLIKHIIAFVYLLAGSLSDIKTREVADWANYGLIALGISFNAMISLHLWQWQPLVYSLLGLFLFWLLAIVLYYAGQWGGGDAKLLMGLGALYGVSWTLSDNAFLGNCLINTLVGGAVYGIRWSIGQAVFHRKAFMQSYKELSKKLKVIKVVALLVTGALLVSSFFAPFEIRLTLVFFALLFAVTFYLWIVIKCVEESCMHKRLPVGKLTEGDWIAEDIIKKGKKVFARKNTGVTKDQIELLKKNRIKDVLVKEGIPFVPSFFLGWLMTFLGLDVFSFLF